MALLHVHFFNSYYPNVEVIILPDMGTVARLVKGTLWEGIGACAWAFFRLDPAHGCCKFGQCGSSHPFERLLGVLSTLGI